MANDASGAPTLTDFGAYFPIATDGVPMLFIAAQSKGASVLLRLVGLVSGAVFEQDITASLPASKPFPANCCYLCVGTAAAVVTCNRVGRQL